MNLFSNKIKRSISKMRKSIRKKRSISKMRKSIRKKRSISKTRKSIRKKRSISKTRRSVFNKINKSIKNDGMEQPLDSIPLLPVQTSIPLLPVQTSIPLLPVQTIKLEKYIEDIELFYEKSFTYTISSFKMFNTNEKINDTFDFIKELFNFHRENDINEIYHNKKTILGLIIISGLYDEFEKFIDDIKTIKINQGVSESKTGDDFQIDCNTRKSPYYKEQHTQTFIKNKLNKLVNKINKINTKDKKTVELLENKYKEVEDVKTKIKDLKVNIENFTKKIITYIQYLNLDKTEEYEYEYEYEIKKFIYYSVCINTDTRKYIMRHYLLHFIKSEIFFKYKDKVLDTFSTDEKNQKTINDFFMNIGNYKIIPYITIYYIKIDRKKYTFSTCGETTLLNLLNYYFINEDGTFTIDKKFSENLQNFYKNYNTMETQLKDIKSTTEAWLEVVSNLKKSDKEEESVRLYNYNGDIHNNIQNIIFVLKTILSSEESEIPKILEKISKKEISIIRKDEKEIQFLLDCKYKVFFKPGHGEIIFYTNIEKKDIEIKDDFGILYNKIFKLINWSGDYTQELSKQIFLILNNDDLLKLEILKLFLTNLTNLNLSSNELTVLPDSIKYLTELTNLNLSYNKLTVLPDNIGYLTKLTNLILSSNSLTVLPDSIKKLIKLTEIRNFAFRYCTALTTIKLPFVTSIGDYAFSDCTSLNTIDLPEVTSIGAYAFSDCTSLREITIPKVQIIKTGAFISCTALTSITLPKDTRIDRAFERSIKINFI